MDITAFTHLSTSLPLFLDLQVAPIGLKTPPTPAPSKRTFFKAHSYTPDCDNKPSAEISSMLYLFILLSDGLPFSTALIAALLKPPLLLNHPAQPPSLTALLKPPLDLSPSTIAILNRHPQVPLCSPSPSSSFAQVTHKGRYGGPRCL